MATRLGGGGWAGGAARERVPPHRAVMLTRVLPALSISKAPLAAFIAVCRARPGPAPPSPTPPAAAMAAGTQLSVAARSQGELKKRGDETGSADGECFRRDFKTNGMHRKCSSGSSGPQGGAIRGEAGRGAPGPR